MFLPEAWDADRDRCREAGPYFRDTADDVVYRPKWEIAVRQYDRATKNGIEFECLAFDEGYGGKPEFLRQMDKRNQRFIGEVPCSFRAWTKPPRTTLKYAKQGRDLPSRHLELPLGVTTRGGGQFAPNRSLPFTKRNGYIY